MVRFLQVAREIVVAEVACARLRWRCVRAGHRWARMTDAAVCACCGLWRGDYD